MRAGTQHSEESRRKMSEAHAGVPHVYATRGIYSSQRLSKRQPCPYGCGKMLNHANMPAHIRRHEFVCKIGGCTSTEHKAFGMCEYHWAIDAKARGYGTTYDEMTSMYDRQLGRCAICETPGGFGGNRGGRGRQKDSLSLDHCHVEGKARGFLCVNCNYGLGQFKDNPELLRAAVAYLEASKQ